MRQKGRQRQQDRNKRQKWRRRGVRRVGGHWAWWQWAQGLNER